MTFLFIYDTMQGLVLAFCQYWALICFSHVVEIDSHLAVCKVPDVGAQNKEALSHERFKTWNRKYGHS